MDFDMQVILWPTIYLLLAVAAVFFVWGIILRNNKRRKNNTWKEMMAIAAFCLTGSGTMLAVHSFDLQLSFVARLGLVTILLIFYAYYSYRRNKTR